MSAVSVAPDGTRYEIPAGDARERERAELAACADTARAAGRQVVAVQGLGFVGSAVAAVVSAARTAADEPRYLVIGVEKGTPESYWKVGKLRAGEPPHPSPDPDLPRLLAEAARGGRLLATDDPCAYGLADVIVVDVPLDVSDRRVTEPGAIALDMGSFGDAIRDIGRFMREDALVLVETTVPPGTCERIVAPLLEEERARRGLPPQPLLAHAAERVMPGPRYVASIQRYWRSFAGRDARSAARAREFLSTIVRTDEFPLFELPDTLSSELAKTLENSYRAANIAFIHEWTLLAEETGVDLFRVIDSVRVRKGTHDNIRFPGFGVGGYCLTKDSLLTQWSLTNFFGSSHALGVTLKALETNLAMPLHTFDLLASLAGARLAGLRVAVLGVSYLPEVPDTRNSPTEILYDRLVAARCVVRVHDPDVRVWPERRAAALTSDLAEALDGAEAVVVAVPHTAYRQLDAATLAGPRGRLVVDAQNVISDATAGGLHAAGCLVAGVGKGHWRRMGLDTP